jgi:hypothetical protein
MLWLEVPAAMMPDNVLLVVMRAEIRPSDEAHSHGERTWLEGCVGGVVLMERRVECDRS